MKQARAQPTESMDRDVAGRDEGQDNEEKDRCGREIALGGAGDMQDRRGDRGRGQRNRDQEERSRMTPEPPKRRTEHAGAQTQTPLKFLTPLPDEVVAHVARVAGPRATPQGPAAALHRMARHMRFHDARPLRQSFDLVPIAVARGKVHHGIDPGRVLAQHLLKPTRALVKLRPVEAGQKPKALDAVPDQRPGSRPRSGGPGE